MSTISPTNSLRPLRDRGNYFHRKRTRKRKWQDELQTTTIYRLAPDAGLTDVQNGILWTTHSFNSTGQRPYPSSIGKLLRLDVRTVVKHIEQLPGKRLPGRGLVGHRRP